MRTKGTNLTGFNPYMQKPVAIRNFEDIKADTLKICSVRSSNGLRGLRILFKAMDRNKNGSVDPAEFKYAMRDFGLELSEIEVTQIVKYFDSNGDGKISFNEFLTAMRGNLSERRLRCVNNVFNKIDKTGSGYVTLATLENCYDCSGHPEFANGNKGYDTLMKEFTGAWETQKKDGCITHTEFCDFYTDISANIAKDEDFESQVRSVWRKVL